MNSISTYSETNSLLWKLRLECYRENNQVGHDCICRVQAKLNGTIGALLNEEAL